MIGRFTHSPTSRIVFGDNIGTLEFSDQTIKFEGNADESATILFDFVAKQFDEHLRNLIAAEREACAQVCEKQIKSYMNKRYTTDPLGGYRERFAAEQCARAIRARGDKHD